MVHLVKGDKSSFFSTQDRYYLSDGELGEKGIKKASTFQKIFGGSVQMEIDGQKIYLNKKSFNKYLEGKIKKISGSSFLKASDLTESFIKASKLNFCFNTLLNNYDAAKKRGVQLKALSQASIMNKEIKLENGDWNSFYLKVYQENVKSIFETKESLNVLIKWKWSNQEKKYRVINADSIPRPSNIKDGRPNRVAIESLHEAFQNSLEVKRAPYSE